MQDLSPDDRYQLRKAYMDAEKKPWKNKKLSRSLSGCYWSWSTEMAYWEQGRP